MEHLSIYLYISKEQVQSRAYAYPYMHILAPVLMVSSLDSYMVLVPVVHIHRLSVLYTSLVTITILAPTMLLTLLDKKKCLPTKLTIKQRKWLLFGAEVKEMLHSSVVEIVLSQSQESCFVFLPLSPLNI